MKFKKIVGFGDSWMYGDELIDPELLKQHPDAHFCWDQNTTYRQRNCFLGQLGQHYDVPTENFGIPGGSLTSTMWTYQWWLDHEQLPLNQCLVLIGLTNSDRVSHYNPNHQYYSNDPPWYKFVHSPWVDSGAGTVPQEFCDLIKQQIVLTTCPELEKLNYQQAVLFFDGISARNSIPTIQFNIMPGERTVPNTPSLIWPDQSFVSWFVQGLQPVHGRKYIKEHGHPNEIGHVLIRDRLISYIDSCTMYEC
jgi:hypothetical protein